MSASNVSDGGAEDSQVVVRVDQERCIGSGMCEMLAEHVFLLDEDTSVAATVGEGMLDSKTALIVIDRCPAGAIGIASVDGDAAGTTE